MVSWIVAVVVALATLACATSLSVVAVAEPGLSRISAAVGAAVLFLGVVLGLAGQGPDASVQLLRQAMIFASKTRWRSICACMIAIVFAVVTTEFGGLRTESFVVSCAGAKRIARPSVPGVTVESCGADGSASFSAWFPMGREDYLSEVRCQYGTGSREVLLPRLPNSAIIACPLREFAYARAFDQEGRTWTWVRDVDGVWRERGSDNVYSWFDEIDSQFLARVDDPEFSQRKRDAGSVKGVLVQRQRDAGQMQVLLPYDIATNQNIFVRDHPDTAWKWHGVLIGVGSSADSATGGPARKANQTAVGD